MVSRFKDLALFRGVPSKEYGVPDLYCHFVRHAIKIFELIKPETVMQFKNQLGVLVASDLKIDSIATLGCTPALASQLLARLEDEGPLYP